MKVSLLTETKEGPHLGDGATQDEYYEYIKSEVKNLWVCFTLPSIEPTKIKADKMGRDPEKYIYISRRLLLK